MKAQRLYRRMLVYLRPYIWPHFALAVVCMLLFSATNGAMPFLIRYIFDDVFTNKNIFVLKVLPGVIIGIFSGRNPTKMSGDAPSAARTEAQPSAPSKKRNMKLNISQSTKLATV